MSHIDCVVKKILEGEDVRTVIEFNGYAGYDIDPWKNGGHDGNYLELPNGKKIEKAVDVQNFCGKLAEIISFDDIVKVRRHIVDLFDAAVKEVFITSNGEDWYERLSLDCSFGNELSKEVTVSLIKGVSHNRNNPQLSFTVYVNGKPQAKFLDKEPNSAEDAVRRYISVLSDVLSKYSSKESQLEIPVKFSIIYDIYEENAVTGVWSKKSGFQKG